LITMFSKSVAEGVLRILGDDEVEVVDQCACLNYTYVLIKTKLGEFLGIAYTPIEDLRAGEVGVVPRVEELPELVIQPRLINSGIRHCFGQCNIPLPGCP